MCVMCFLTHSLSFTSLHHTLTLILCLVRSIQCADCIYMLLYIVNWMPLLLHRVFAIQTTNTTKLSMVSIWLCAFLYIIQIWSVEKEYRKKARIDKAA